MTSLDGINGRSIQTLLRGENDSKQSDEFQAIAESASSNIVLYSRFIWLNGSITLIRAETERYDIVRFSKVTAKSLASGTGS